MARWDFARRFGADCVPEITLLQSKKKKDSKGKKKKKDKGSKKKKGKKDKK